MRLQRIDLRKAKRRMRELSAAGAFFPGPIAIADPWIPERAFGSKPTFFLDEFSGEMLPVVIEDGKGNKGKKPPGPPGKPPPENPPWEPWPIPHGAVFVEELVRGKPLDNPTILAEYTGPPFVPWVPFLPFAPPPKPELTFSSDVLDNPTILAEYTGPVFVPWVPFAPFAPPPKPEPPVIGKTLPNPTILAEFTGPAIEIWFPQRATRQEIPVEPPGPAQTRPLPSPETFSGTPRVPPQILVHYDEQATTRSRRHQQIVANILNGLIRQGDLVQTDIGEWELGFFASDQQDWSGGVPDTVAEALDRIATAIKALDGAGP